MADYGAHIPPTDIDLKWATEKKEEARRELLHWEAIVKRLRREHEAEYRSA